MWEWWFWNVQKNFLDILLTQFHLYNLTKKLPYYYLVFWNFLIIIDTLLQLKMNKISEIYKEKD